MITYADVYKNWLNREQSSHLSNRSRFSIWQIIDPKLPESQKDSMIEALINSTRGTSNEHEYLEVLVFAGKTQAERRKLSDAKRHLELAVHRYTALNDPIRAAATKWMLSIAEWQMADNNVAFANAKSARETFERIANERRQELLARKHSLPGLEENARWFTEHVILMNDDLIAKPEEAFTWLNKFEESYLSTPAKQLRTLIFQSVVNRDFYRVNDLLRELQEMVRIGLDPCERAEVYTFCGLIYHQIGNGREAEKNFRLSTSLFPPDRHHHTVVRWMQAMVQSQDAARRSSAIRLCNDCVRCFEWLRLDADHRNRSVECRWYETQAATLRRAITGLTSRI